MNINININTRTNTRANTRTRAITNIKKCLTIALLMITLPFTVHAKEVIKIYWPFSVQSHEYAEILALGQELSAVQPTDYIFVVESKPGAGGSIAIRALDQNKRAVVATTNGMYARPFLYRSNNYSVDTYTPLAVFCHDVPLGLYSSKRLGSPIRFNGTTLGSFSGIVSEHLKRQGIVSELVSYKGNPEAMIDVMNKTIDSAVDYLGPSSLARIKGTDISVLAITGTRDIGPYKTFKSLGYPGLEKLVTDFILIGHKDNTEVNAIVVSFMKRLRSVKARELCEQANGTWYTPTAVFDSVQYQRTNKEHAKIITNNIPPLD